MQLNEKQVVITGASGALGGAVAERARSLGAELTLLDISIPRGPTSDRWCAVDLTDAGATANCFAEIDRIDVLLHLAGGFDMGEGADAGSTSAWRRLFDTNVLTLQNCLAGAVPKMRGRGRGSIVTVGALAALSGRSGMAAYCAAKSAVMRITESLAAEVGPTGINVNSVLPSVIDTPANRRSMPDADPALWVNPSDLANVICFLASDGARAMNGALVPVAGLMS